MIAEMIKEARKARKLSQQQLAAKIGLKRVNTISEIERGYSSGSGVILEKIFKELDIELIIK